MSPLTISEVARRLGLRASAIRYYEQIGLLPRAQRISGQRRYDATVFHSLAVVQRARRLGFTLREVRQLFFGFRPASPASERWQRLSRDKLAELEAQAREIRAMQRRLREMIRKCRCDTLEQCGRGIYLSGDAGPGGASPRRPANWQRSS
jgi:MerR family transcriptional regulator, redox-sensitive transcriptional activator SoxR